MDEKSLLKKKLAGRLAKYSAAAGAVVAISSNADAQVAHSGEQNILINSPGVLNAIDLDGDGTTDFNFGLAWDSYLLNGYDTYSAFVQNPASNSWVGFSMVYALSNGYSINASLTNWTDNLQGYYNLGYEGSNGPFMGEGDSYVGVRFEINAGEFHFGWIRLNLNESCTELLIQDWAYQTEPGTPITAGEGAPNLVPTCTLSTEATEPVNGEFNVIIAFSESTTGLSEDDINVTNGSVKENSLTTINGGLSYNVTIIPQITGDITIALPAGVAQDGDGNNNEVATDLVVEADLPPTVALSSSEEGPVNGEFDITITFNEEVSGLIESEIVVTNGTVKTGTLSTADNITYTATITPAASGDVTIALPANVAQDAVGNDNEAAIDLVVEADFDAPTVEITTSATEPVSGTFSITITFNEETTGLTESDISVTNGTLNTLITSDNGITYTANVTPVGAGDVTIALPANVAQDLAGNNNEAATNLVVTAIDDIIAPTVGLSRAVIKPVNGEFDITITFSEETTGLTEGEIVVTNGSVKESSLITNDAGITYTVTIIPIATGDVTISLPANVAQDATGNNNEAATDLIVEADFDAPTAALSTSAIEPVNGEFDITLTFSEEMEELTETDITVTNGTVKASSLSSADNITFTATIIPTASGDVTISLAASVAQDLAGNGNEAATDLVVEADLPPTVALSSPEEGPVNGEFDITITFNEEVSGLIESEIVVTNGTVKTGTLSTADNITYTATITPTATGDVTISVAEAVAQDLAGNGNEAAIDLVIEADFDAPTVEITTSATEPVSGTFSITITFNEETTGLTESDISVTNGTLNTLISSDNGITYTANVTPVAAGDVTIALPANVAQDLAGNDNEAATNLVVTAIDDIIAPTVGLSGPAIKPVNGEFEITITFSEETTGLTEGEIVVTNGSVKASSLSSTDNIAFTATIIPTASGDVTISLPANVAQDAAGNDNEAATDLVVKADLPPTVVLSSPEEGPVNGEFDITITFNEEVSGLIESEIVVTNGIVKTGTLSTADNITYTATITPTASGDVTISVAAAVVQDLAGNGNEAATDLVVEADLDAPTVEITTSVSEPVNGEFDVTITFSEETTGLTEGEIDVTNGSVNTGSLSTTDGGLTYMATITPTASGDVTIALPSNVAQDAAGNDNEAATDLVVEADLDAPTVEITTSVSEPVNGEFDITITFSEEIEGLTEPDISVTNGSVKESSLASTDNITFTATITPTATGDVTISLAASVVQDLAGNDNEAATDLIVEADFTSGIGDLHAGNEVLAYPNPTTGFMKLDFSKTELDVNSIAITGLSGRLIHQQKVTSSSVNLDLSTYEKGMYILIIQTDTKQFTKKIVVE